ncbi:MAG TPA: cytochrome C oxidase subunit IV family protein [Acidimicrobiales bacterium]
MSTTTTNEASPTAEEELLEHAHDHPSDGDYVKIAIILGVITAAEVGTYFWKDIFGSEPSTFALVATLFPMMIAKFIIVIGYFMHLKYDNPLFKRVFIFGLLLAMAVFIAALSAFEFWDDRFLRFLTGG